ncbi:MAG: hypothetical protein M3P27_03855 [Acidobacteriota bacterium]|nr:hypothetical protein [Acidobacteriota bacterium]
MRRNVFCYFHNEYYNGSSENTLPSLEDGNGVQLALMMVLERLRREAFRGAEVNVPVVKQLLYGLQTAVINLRNTNFDPVLAAPMITDPATADNEAEASAMVAKKPTRSEQCEPNSDSITITPAGD